MRLLRPLFFAGFITVATILHAAAPLTRFLPARSYGVMQMDNSAELRERWNRSPWARTFADEQVLRFFAPLREQLKLGTFDEKLKAETGHTLEELITLFNSPCAAAFTDLQIDPAGGKPPSVGLVFILQLGGKREMLENLLAPKPGRPPETTWDYRGVTVHETTGTPADAEPSAGKPSRPDVFWAVVDDYWVIATPRAVVEEIVSGVQQDGLADPFSRSAFYQEMQQQAGTQALSAYMNLRRLITDVGGMAEQAVAEKTRDKPGGNPFGLTVKGVLHAVGLDTLEAGYLGTSIGESSTDIAYNITFAEERGLTKLFAASDGRLTLPPWVRADWSNAAVLQLSMPHFYAVLEEMLGDINPNLLATAQGQLQMMQQRFGVDLKKDVFGVLGDHIVVGQIPGPEQGATSLAALQQNQNLIAFSTTDPKRLLSSLETLGSMGGQLPQSLFETRDYLGAKIYSMRRPPNAPPATKQVFFAIAGGYWLLAIDDTARPLESVLQSLNGTAAGSLWEKPDVKQAIASFAPGAIGYSYQDMPALFSKVFDALSLIQGQNDAASEAAEEKEQGNDAEAATPAPKRPTVKMVDPEQKPSYELLRRYWSNSVAATWRDAHSLRSLTRISHTPAQQ